MENTFEFCEFCEICKNTFFTEHLRTTASEHFYIISVDEFLNF